MSTVRPIMVRLRAEGRFRGRRAEGRFRERLRAGCYFCGNFQTKGSPSSSSQWTSTLVAPAGIT